MRNILLSAIVLAFVLPELSAQTFTELPQTPLFPRITLSSFDFADIDGDDDQDLLLTGLDDQNQPAVKLFKNDGDGNFTEETDIPFTGVFESTVNFADVDGDNDMDVLITGAINIVNESSTLYINDGAGNFTAINNTPFVGVQKGAVAFADIDGDDDLDLLITGENNLDEPVSALYENNGAGAFTEIGDNTIFAIERGSVSFSDVDGDNDLDLFIFGINGFFGNTALYDNDGSGNFTLTSTDFATPSNGVSGFADLDGDNDPDLLITGFSFSSGESSTQLYINDGSGNFTEIENSITGGFTDSSLAFADVDGDNDNDILFTGGFDGDATAKLFTNDGSGNFTEVTDFPVQGAREGQIGFVDVNSDNLPDIFITGTNSFNRNAKLYINETTVANQNVAPFSFDLNLFPNPSATNLLNIHFTTTASSRITMKVFDNYGRLLVDQEALVNLGTQKLVIDLHPLEPGNYILELSDGGRKGSKQFIIR